MTKREEKLVLILTAILIIVSSFILHNNPTQGYELSIYEHIPPVVYLEFVILALITVGLFKYAKNKMLFIFPAISLVIVLLFVPIIRGYVQLFRFDAFTHIGYTKVILRQHHVPKVDGYPAFHLILGYLVTILNTTYNSALWIEAYSLSLIGTLILFIYLKQASNVIFKNSPLRKLSFRISLLLFWGLFPLAVTTPTDLAIILIPLLLYALYKVPSSKTMIIVLFISVLALIIAHSLFVAYIIVALLLILAMPSTDILNIKNTMKKLLAFTSITYSWWVISNVFIYKGIKLAQVIFYPEQSQVKEISTVSQKLNLSWYGILELVIKLQGKYIIPNLLAILVLIRLITHKKGTRPLSLFILFGLPLMLADVLVFLSYILGKSGEILIRFLWITQIYSIIIITYGLIALIHNRKMLKASSVVISLIILTIMIISIYPSPLTLRMNTQVTPSEVQGMKWFFKYSEPKYPVFQPMAIARHRFEAYILGVPTYDQLTYRWHILPDHFNIDALTYNQYYSVIGKPELLAYTTVWKSVNRYNFSDLNIYLSRGNVNKIYNVQDLMITINQ